MSKCLIIRFSSLGDLALSVPVIHSVVNQNPETTFYLLTRQRFKDLFEPINRLKLLTPDFNKDYQGLRGLFLLRKKLDLKQFDHIIDIHNVIRSRIITIGAKQVYRLDKQRQARRAVINKKSTQSLTPMTLCYGDVFRQAGYKLDQIAVDPTLYKPKQSCLSARPAVRRIGYAPFSVHKQKAVPISKSIEILAMLKEMPVEVSLYGGEDDIAQARLLEGYISGANFVGQYPLRTELRTMADLDLMISADSANGHLASIVGVPVMTIWGATDYRFGFGPWASTPDDYISFGTDLDCHPCSVFGKKPCKRGDLACLSKIDVKFIADRLLSKLNR